MDHPTGGYFFIFLFQVTLSTASTQCVITTHGQGQGQVALKSNRVGFKIPLPMTLIQSELDNFDTIMNFTETSFAYENTFVRDGVTKKILVPSTPSSSIMQAKAFCISRDMTAATIDDITHNGIQHLFHTVSAVNYALANDKDNIECYLDRLRETGKECFDAIQSLNISNSIGNIYDFEKRLRNMTLGIFGFKDSRLMLQDDSDCLLPCIMTVVSVDHSKWAILRDNYLLPIYVQLMNRYLTITNWLQHPQDDTHQRKEGKHNKRSILSSILGLAGSDETEELRKALKVELQSQRNTNKAVEGMLREQILTAKAINRDQKLLFSLKSHENKLEGDLHHLTTYLQKSLSETHKFEERAHRDTQAIMLTLTTLFGLLRLESQLDSIVDVLHCPHGNCLPHLHTYFLENDNWDESTYSLILDTMTTALGENSIYVSVDNITSSSFPVFTIECLPWLENNHTMRLDIDGHYTTAFNGFMNIDSCERTHTVWYCRDVIWRSDKCLSNLLIRKSMKTTDCTHHIKKQAIDQDYIVDYQRDELFFFSKEVDTIVFSSEGEDRKGFLHSGMNSFPISGTSMTSVHTSKLTFLIHPSAPVRTSDIEWLTDIIELHDIPQDNLSNYFVLNLATTDNGMELNYTTIPVPEFQTLHPVTIFLGDKKNWYWTLGSLGFMMGLCLVVSYICCKFKHNICCSLYKQASQTDNDEVDPIHDNQLPDTCTATQDSPGLILSPMKQTHMTIHNLSFFSEIRATFQEQTIFWDGVCWRYLASNAICTYNEEPPSILSAQLHSTNIKQVITTKDTRKVISLESVDNVFFDTLRGRWILQDSDSGSKRYLPQYVAAKPSMDLLRQLSTTRQATT